MTEQVVPLEQPDGKGGPSRPGIPHLTGWVLPAVSSILVTGGSILVGWAIGLDPVVYTDKNFYALESAALIVVGLAVLATAQVITLVRHKRRIVEVTNFNDHLSGVHQALTDLVQSDKRSDARREFFRSAIRQGTALFSLDGVRVCVYELDAKEGEKDDAQLVPYLRLVDFSGRADPPRPEFNMSTSHGQAIVDAAANQKQVTVSDRNHTNVPIDFNPGTVWRSFFVVPLINGSYESRGVLTVDTREQSDFTYVDVTVARTLASLIVIGMDELYSAAKDTKPELTEVLDKLSAIEARAADPKGGAK